MENRTELVEIDKIIVNDRIRKDFGNIEELAQDIKENGLINPPVVTPEFELIAGERRYKAMKSLGWQQIEVRVMSVQDALHKLKLEISENENRKDFSFNERMEWARILEKEYKKKGNENMIKGITLDNNLQRVDANKSVAQEIGFGNKETYRQAKYIYENANEEMIKQLDEGKLSINKCFNTLKDKAKQLEQENSILKQSLETEKNKQPIVKEKVVDNTDYTLQNKVNEYENKIKYLEDKIKILKEGEEINMELISNCKKEVEEYKQFKDRLLSMQSINGGDYDEVNTLKQIDELYLKIDNFIRTDLSPVKYSNCIKFINKSSYINDSFNTLVNTVQQWCDDMRNELNQNNNIINVEVR